MMGAPGAGSGSGMMNGARGMMGGVWLAGDGIRVTSIAAAGESATEVLVDPVSGAVSTEPGPAMMWNIRYGMHIGANTSTALSAEQAGRLADAWLATNRPDRHAEPADAYPGYYTLEFTRGRTVDGMLSINATTGQVWYHSWHGRFIAREDG